VACLNQPHRAESEALRSLQLSQLRPKKSTPVEYEPPIEPSEIPPDRWFIVRYLLACLPSVGQYVSREKQREALKDWSKKRGHHEQ
jgi:hypothetical protein